MPDTRLRTEDLRAELDAGMQRRLDRVGLTLVRWELRPGVVGEAVLTIEARYGEGPVLTFSGPPDALFVFLRCVRATY